MQVRYSKILVFGYADEAATHLVALQADDGRFYLVDYVVLATGAYLPSRDLKLAEKYASKEMALAAAEVLKKRLGLPIETFTETYEEMHLKALGMYLSLVREQPCLGTLGTIS